jgi:hypothetical protein
MRRFAAVSAVVLCLGLASAPAFADDPAPAPTPANEAIPAPAAVPAGERASDADIDRLLQVMDARSMMDKVMQQMTVAQQAMVEEAIGKDASAADRARMHELVAKTNAVMLKHMSWNALEPVMRRVYAQVFDKQEVDAMIAFYSSREGASILKKTPQVLAISMQEIQPIIRDAMTEMKATIDEEIKATAKSKRPRS